MSIVGCARCHGEGHEALTFTRLTHPVEQEGARSLTHWARCPTNREPILMVVFDPAETAAAEATEATS